VIRDFVTAVNVDALAAINRSVPWVVGSVHLENSDVFPLASVAVAVTRCPEEICAETLKLAAPLVSV